jgi:hypothetical protein
MLIRFQRIVQDQSLLEVDFGARVFRYGTPFDGALVDTESDEVPLSVNAGDAIAETLSDELTVRTGLKGAILPDLTVSPNPFSPNDDGFNDQVTLSSAVLRLTGDTPVDLQIFDLSGRLIRTLSQVVSGSASFAMEWDGQDEAGILAPPGLYVFRLAVDTDTGSHTRLGQVALVY